MHRARSSLSIAILAATTVASAAVGATELAPHRALYDMRLARTAAPSGGIVGARGAMLYRFAETCTAWEVETRVHLRLTYDRGGEAETVATTWIFTATEAKDGRRYDFGVDHKRAGQTIERIEGSVLRPDPSDVGGDVDAAAEAVLAEPQDGTMHLAAGTLFPARHLEHLLAAAAQGERRFERPVFDGASLENPYDVSAVIIGPVREGGAASSIAEPSRTGSRMAPRLVHRRSAIGLAKVRAAGIADTPAWRMRLAFFPLGLKPAANSNATPADSTDPPAAWGAGLPDFEIEVDYRADGIAERIYQDFGDFALNLEAAEIEPLARPNC